MKTHAMPDLDAAIDAMLAENRANPWFLNTFWPENQDRVRRILSDLAAFAPPAPQTRVLDIGCFNGFLSFLLHRLGYRVTATDIEPLSDRDALFSRVPVEFFLSNLNSPEALRGLPDRTFDAVVMAEVFEHIFNHPLGLLREIARILRPGGLLVLTTPNPSTLMNVWRVLCNRHSLWGTHKFIELPKVDRGQPSTAGDIHFREYLPDEIDWALGQAGFTIVQRRYLTMGSSAGQSPLKRLLKRLPFSETLRHTRLLASIQYVLARSAQTSL